MAGKKQAPVEETKKTVSASGTVSLKEIIGELNEVLDLAMQLEKPSAAVSAIMAKAKVSGLLNKDDEEDGDIDDSPIEIIHVE